MFFSLRIFDEFFSGFRAKFQKIVTCVAFSIKFVKLNQKIAENSEFCEKKFTIIQNYSLHSLVATAALRDLRRHAWWHALRVEGPHRKLHRPELCGRRSRTASGLGSK